MSTYQPILSGAYLLPAHVPYCMYYTSANSRAILCCKKKKIEASTTAQKRRYQIMSLAHWKT